MQKVLKHCAGIKKGATFHNGLNDYPSYSSIRILIRLRVVMSSVFFSFFSLFKKNIITSNCTYNLLRSLSKFSEPPVILLLYQSMLNSSLFLCSVLIVGKDKYENSLNMTRYYYQRFLARKEYLQFVRESELYT